MVTESGSFLQPTLLGLVWISTHDPLAWSEHFNTGPKHTENITDAYC